MPHVHEAGGPFEFPTSSQTRAFSCRRVVEGAPVLHVAHESDGGWLFLCGEDHGDAAQDEEVAACIRCVAERDPSLNHLADLCRNHEARRAGAGQPWALIDLGEQFIRDWVEKLGWAVQFVDPGEAVTEPPFAYTVGLTKTFQHPELIVVGQKRELMHFMLNECAYRVKDGLRLTPGMLLDGVIEGFAVEVRALDPKLLSFLGYARWFYEGRPFEALQVVWPDLTGRFPGDPAVEGWASQQQRLA